MKTSKEGLSSDVTEHFILSQSQMVYSFETSIYILLDLHSRNGKNKMEFKMVLYVK